MKQENKGITLIALVITIIVLLILAAVSIATLTGENGILTKAQEAKTQNTKSQAEEEVKLAVASLLTEETTTQMTQEEKRQLLENELKQYDSSSTVAMNGAEFLITHRGYEFEIDENYQVSNKEPFDIEKWDEDATPETCFEWGSDILGEEGYNTIVGWKEEIQEYESIKIPTRCKIIEVTSNTGKDFVQGIKKVKLPETITEIGYYAFGYYDSNYAFTSLTTINIPNSVEYIGTMAFNNCTSLTNITIPDSVKEIDMGAFKKCINLSDITISDKLSVISSQAFSDTAWYDNQEDGVVYAGNVAYKYKGTMPENTTIQLKDGTTGIADKAFNECTGLTNIIIPEGVTVIGNNAISDCTNLNSITLPDSVIKVCSAAFRNTGWYNNHADGILYAGKVLYSYKGTMPENTSIEIQEGTIALAESAFINCTNLVNVTIPNSVKFIGEGAFQRAGLTSVTIPDSVTSIEFATFWNCTNLTSATIPNSITSIEDSAFINCTGLTSLTIPDSVTSIGTDAFYNVPHIYYNGTATGSPWGALAIN